MDIGLTLTAFGGMLAGFFAIARLMLSQASKDREADRQERNELSAAIKKMAKSSEQVAQATTKSAAEAKERNGHLGEQSVQIAALIKSTRNDVLAAVGTQEVKIQHVQQQNVDNSTVDGDKKS